MSSSLTKLSNCGTKSQPWILEAPAGQQINVSLLDFGARASSIEPNNCYPYGNVIDKMTRKNLTICRLVKERKRLLYTSVSNVIQIILNFSMETEEPTEQVATFLIRIQCTQIFSCHYFTQWRS